MKQNLSYINLRVYAMPFKNVKSNTLEILLFQKYLTS